MEWPGALGGGSLDREVLDGKAVLVVNVASRCGHTPQYAGLQRLHERFAGRGFTVLGVPCNQFAEEEPGAPAEIAEFCSSNYGVTFPLTAKLEVNGKRRHPLYAKLVRARDDDGEAGDVAWNFEKFLVAPDGRVAGRFRPGVEPESWEIVEAIEALLPEA
ncbi:glutathione peroxidase [Pseudonocardia acidicola]|uniref:Glutathione peroxidase n=1 Tax=Pseudonocardia acidicola TaxID=2724939 RepID=A0ABX1S878_9PSEU|nr:glutathione peroxidase [Pseudonocardia acidicola]NMH97290.1 glutathione peroxidase [Pseudonocardia acidicola]